jgi:hypothetical protein
VERHWNTALFLDRTAAGIPHGGHRRRFDPESEPESMISCGIQIDLVVSLSK